MPSVPRSEYKKEAHVDKGLCVCDGELLGDSLLDLFLLGLHVRGGLGVSG